MFALCRKSAFHRALVITALAFTVAVPAAVAKERKTMFQGVMECKSWCDQNNSTLASQAECRRKCEVYWMCNGSDSTATTCADAPRSAALPSPTPNPPPPTSNVAPLNQIKRTLGRVY
jgi:hypothetical protein